MKLLIVEDETRVADFISRGLQAEGHTTALARDGRSGLEAALSGDSAVVILDVMLPDFSGLDVCQQMRAAGSRTPVLMLSALDSTDDKVAGLRMGADDYLTKPFAFDELVARVEALARRSRAASQPTVRIVIGCLVFDRESLSVSVEGRRVELTAKELALLELLLSTPGKVFTRASILNNVWGYTADPLTNVIDVYIHRLRGKLQPARSDRTPIVTVRGVGFRLDPDSFTSGAEVG
jgi:DNA-binding response OmpR family regulator